jgi:hypothetical protein
MERHLRGDEARGRATASADGCRTMARTSKGIKLDKREIRGAVRRTPFSGISISVESFSSVAEEVYLRGPKVPPQFLLLLYLLTFFVPGDHQEAKMTPDTTKFFKFT